VRQGKDRRELIESVIEAAKLDEREREIIALEFGMYGEEMKSQKEIADKLGIGPRRVRQIKKIAMEKIASALLQPLESHLMPPGWELFT
jgi:RNA polymerase sigma factor (sigma-70 family)